MGWNLGGALGSVAKKAVNPLSNPLSILPSAKGAAPNVALKGLTGGGGMGAAIPGGTGNISLNSLAGGNIGGILGGGGGGNPLGGLLGGIMGGGPGQAAPSGMGGGLLPSLLGGGFGLPSGAQGINGMLNPLAPKKAQVNSTAETEGVIKKYSDENPFTSALGADGSLKAPYAIAAPNKVAAGSIAKAAGTGNIGASLVDPSKLAVNTDALNALKAKGMAAGPSAWAQLANQQNQQNLLANKDEAGAQADTAAAAARNAIAMKGGLGGGAAERIASNASRDMNANRQGATRAANVNGLNIGMQDETNKNAILSQIPGMDLANANYGAGLAQYNAGATTDANKFNVGTNLTKASTDAANNLQANEYNSTAGTGVAAQNAANALGSLGANNTNALSKFQTQIAGYGASKTADATQNAGKK